MNPDAVPRDLRNVDRWVPWKWSERKGKRTKPPLHCADPTRSGKVNDPSTWGKFEQALAAVEAGLADGVGVVVPEGYAGADIDGCRDPRTGELDALGRWAVDVFDSYTEVTPSGMGIRVWGRTAAAFERKKYPALGAELYTGAGDPRYFTVTGETLDGSRIEDLTEEFAQWWSDVSVLAETCGTDEARAAIWRDGDTSAYPSPSEADLAFASMLAHRTADDEQVVRILQRSPLWDEKWEREDYRRDTLARARRDRPRSEPHEVAEGRRPEVELRDLPGDQALDNVRSFVRRYVAMTDEQAAAVALWVAHTYVIDRADTTLYLHVTSAEKRSGKSRLLEVLEVLVARPLFTPNISPAALFRMVEGHTVLFDEVDAIFDSGRTGDAVQDLRGLLNAGYRRGGYAIRIQMVGTDAQPRLFPVFGAKVLAGIGELPDTLADRCCRIRMQRTTGVERFRRRAVEAQAAVVAGELARWVEPLAELADARPAEAEEINDRLADTWEPLLAIADAAGGGWPGQARGAASALAREARTDADESLGVALLRDIRGAFGERDRLRSQDLLTTLWGLEDAPWGHGNENLDAYRLSRMLKPFGVRSRSIQLATGQSRGSRGTAKGYLREQFEDAWSRYL